ncbi:PAK4-inhibitor INKA2 isoform X1 [Oryzias latipes]|uniref:PAK4-inhibitor INKA2 n=3 Tax=Oryzias latipes TaxID=8090 RepID=A0A3B3I4Q8_ORYLA|nr:PAK4-inhibitor INKA2 isoform X1 [Oryzias latipes]
MEQRLYKLESRNMDSCLRRLKLELLSMKEAGDGLHAQMNSMMGALQELKLLQVQTALESLDISGRPINRGMPHPAPAAPSHTRAAASAEERSSSLRQTMMDEPSPSPMLRPRLSVDSPNSSSRGDEISSQSRSSLETSSSSTSSLESESESEASPRSARNSRSENDLESIPRRWSGYTAPQVDFCGPVVGNPPPEPYLHSKTPRAAQVMDLPGILYSLSREGPSLDSDYSQDSADDGSDWTSSLMSRSRNRQPLVLGDNVFADLVGNWLDLPEVEREEGKNKEWRKRRDERTLEGSVDRPDTPAHPLRLSRSQEICKKFSLTTNIFKKFLRSVRPDRDKLLKERPGWVAPELQEGDIFKRPKKVAPKNSKGSFYLPFWANGQQGKGRPCPERSSHLQLFPQFQQQPFTGIYLDRRQPDTGLEKMQPLFDYNTAVWV